MQTEVTSEPRPRLLFVDDEQRVLNSMRIMFRRQFDLFLASHGAQALDIVKTKDIDVIVADHRMPQMTGVEVLTKVRQLSPRTVRILLTGYADLDAVEGSINDGEVFRFLTKPCAPQQLRDTVELAAKLARAAPAPPAAAPDVADVLEIILESDRVTQIGGSGPRPSSTPSSSSPSPSRGPASAAPASASPAAARSASAPSASAPPAAGRSPSAAPVAGPSAAAASAAAPAAAASPASARNRAAPGKERPAPQAAPAGAAPPPRQGPAAAGEADDSAGVDGGFVSTTVMGPPQLDAPAATGGPAGLPRPQTGLGVVVFSADDEMLQTVQRAVRGRLPVYHATNIVKVVRVLTEHRPGVLITDVSGEKATIQSMTARLKQHLPQLVTIAVSAHRDVLDMVWLINHGQIFRFLRKPLSPGRCAISLQAALQHHLMLLKNPELCQRHQVDAVQDGGLVDGLLAKLKSMKRLWAAT